MKNKIIVTLLCILFAMQLNAQNLAPNPGFRNLDPAIPNPKGYCWNAGLAGSGVNASSIPYVGGDAKAVQIKEWWIWLNGGVPTDKNNLCVISETLPLGTNCIPYPPTNDRVTDNIKMDKMLHLKLTKPQGGIVTVIVLPAKSSKQVYSCWVYVVKGKAQLGTMHDPGTGTVQTVGSTTTCKWERLTLTRTDNQGNEITIYGIENDAEFYVCSVAALF